MKRTIAVLMLGLMAAACSPGGEADMKTTPQSSLPTAESTTSTTAPTPASQTSTTAPTETSTTEYTSLITRGASLPDARPRTSIPWDEVDGDWMVVLYEGVEAEVLYLVSPDGALFEITGWDAGSGPPHSLVELSPGLRRVLIRRFNPLPAPSIELQILDMQTGEAVVVDSIPYDGEAEPMGSLWGGFTTPTGRNLMVYKVVDGAVSLERRTQSGTVLSTFQAVGPWLYSPDGTRVVIGDNNGLHLYQNDGVFLGDLADADPKLARRSAVPLRWWSPDQLLATWRWYGNPHSRGHGGWDDISLGVADMAGSVLSLDGLSAVSSADVYLGAWPIGDRTVIEVAGPVWSSQYFWGTKARLTFEDGMREHRILGVMQSELMVFAFDPIEGRGVIGRYSLQSTPGEPAKQVELLVPKLGDAKGVVEVLSQSTWATRRSDGWPLPRAGWPGFTQPLVDEDVGSFEAYQPGWYPHREGWFYQEDSGGASVSAERAHTGIRSFRLSVDDDQTLVLGRGIDMLEVQQAIYEVAVNCSSEGSSGAEIGFSEWVERDGCDPPYCETEMRNSVRLENDGTVTVTGSPDSPGGIVNIKSVPWSFDTWHVVRVELDYQTGKVSAWLDAHLLAADVPAASYDWSSTFAISKIGGQPGVVYFDDISFEALS